MLFRLFLANSWSASRAFSTSSFYKVTLAFRASISVAIIFVKSLLRSSRLAKASSVSVSNLSSSISNFSSSLSKAGCRFYILIKFSSMRSLGPTFPTNGTILWLAYLFSWRNGDNQLAQRYVELSLFTHVNAAGSLSWVHLSHNWSSIFNNNLQLYL